MAAAGVKAKMQKKSAEEALAGFNALRSEQRQIAAKIYELEGDLSEHRIVIEALKATEGDRKCFRMIGGILVEGVVKEVLPNLSTNADQMKNVLDSLNSKLIEKGKDILEYKEKNPGSFVVGGQQQQHPDKIVEEEEPVEPDTSKSKSLLET